MFHKIQLGFQKVIKVAKPQCNNLIDYFLFSFSCLIFFFGKSIQVCWCNLFWHELGFNTMCESHTKTSSLGTNKEYRFSGHISKCQVVMFILSFSLKISLFLQITKSYSLRDINIQNFRLIIPGAKNHCPLHVKTG